MADSVVFASEFAYAMDDRGRVPVPPEYRDDLGHKLILKAGEDKCVDILPLRAFERLAQRVTGGGDNFDAAYRLRLRAFYRSVKPVAIDAQGRIPVPQKFRDDYNLNGRVVVVGVGDHLELWSPEGWEEQLRLMASTHLPIPQPLPPDGQARGAG